MTSGRVTPPASGYTDVDRSADPSVYVQRLDQVGATEVWQSIKRRTIALIDPKPGERVLDVGCGTGDDARALAELVVPGGAVVGVDLSATMIAEARRRTASSGLPVEFVQGDSQRLELASDSFDACRVERVLQHVREPKRVLEEMVRVARRGGRIVAVEPDYGSLLVSGGNPAITRAIVSARVAHFQSGRVGRELQSYCKALGLVGMRVSLVPITSLAYDLDDNSGVLQKYTEDAEAGGSITSAQAGEWLHAVREAASRGEYRHTVMVYIVAGTKP